MGVLTDGIVYEFYADSDEPNMMDSKAFLSFNLRDVAKGKIEDSILEGVKNLQKAFFDPENIGAEAKRKIIFQSIVEQIKELSQNPSEPFVRLLLQGVGLTHVRKAIDDYTSLTKEAFKEFINSIILERLDLPQQTREKEKPVMAEEVITLEREEVEEVRKISLADLVKANILPAGSVVFDKGRRWYAIITEQGKLSHEGKEWTPSGLATNVLKVGSYNGWVFWYIERKGRLVSLAELREEAESAVSTS